jgi:hypothetical protein
MRLARLLGLMADTVCCKSGRGIGKELGSELHALSASKCAVYLDRTLLSNQR